MFYEDLSTISLCSLFDLDIEIPLCLMLGVGFPGSLWPEIALATRL
jgi:hypothetical protein